jgi:hypothetical protein
MTWDLSKKQAGNLWNFVKINSIFLLSLGESTHLQLLGELGNN